MDLLDDGLDPGSEFDDRLVQQEEIALLRKAISLLPESQKDLLYFKYLLEMSDSEIGETIGISPDSVRQYLTRARRNARRLMEKEMSGSAE